MTKVLEDGRENVKNLVSIENFVFKFESFIKKYTVLIDLLTFFEIFRV